MRIIILFPWVFIGIFLLLALIKHILIVIVMLSIIKTRNWTLWLDLISKLLTFIKLCPNRNMWVDIIFAHSDWLWGREIILGTVIYVIYGIALDLTLLMIVIVFVFIQFYLVNLTNLFGFVVLYYILSHKPIRISWHYLCSYKRKNTNKFIIELFSYVKENYSCQIQFLIFLYIFYYVNSILFLLF